MATEEQLRSYLRRATDELRAARRRLSEQDARDSEPVAVVGVGCRFPGGVVSAQGLWDLVAAGRDALVPFPTDRYWSGQGWPVRQGGFLDQAGGFDADFFGISPR